MHGKNENENDSGGFHVVLLFWSSRLVEGGRLIPISPKITFTLFSSAFSLIEKVP